MNEKSSLNENYSLNEIFLQDLLYDAARKSGFLYNALNYNKKKRKAASAPVILEDEIQMTEEDKEETINFFKRCVLPDDRKSVEKRMIETKSFRRRLIVDDLQKYQECWQFYFVCPDLVSDFNFLAI